MTGLLARCFDVFTMVFSRVILWLQTVVGLFFDFEANALTFFGTFALASLGISIFFLLMRVVQNFLHFRG